MPYLVITSLLWAVSFGLVKGQFMGVDAAALSCIRLLIASLVFAPFFRPSGLTWQTALRLTGIGALQFGLMYIFYLKSFTYLAAYQVALFTIFTPLYVVLIDAWMEKRWTWKFLWASLLAGAGAAVTQDFHSFNDAHFSGFMLVQCSNLCFAAGQLLWRREHIRMEGKAKDAQLFALPYLGALLCTSVVSWFTTDWQNFSLNTTQWASVLYLGIIASGLCFFLWNVGAAKVNAGLLAVMNNGKIPIAIAVSLVVFQEKADLLRLLLGGALIAAGIMMTRTKPQERARGKGQ